MKPSLPYGMLLVVFICIGAAPSMAAPGDPDLNFGGFGSGGTMQIPGFTISAIAIDAQGRLVLAGTCNKTFCVQRRSGPRFLTVENSQPIIIDSGQDFADANAMVIAPDGKIVVAGTLFLRDRDPDFAVARLNADLTLDTSFAGDGTTSSDFDHNFDIAYAVAVQGDDKIVVAGSAKTGIEAFTSDFAVERFNSDGTLDRTFNGNGKWTHDVSPTVSLGEDNELFSIVIQPDGKLLVGGYAEVGTFATANPDFAIMRLNPNGSIDGDFGDDGLVSTDFGTEDTVASLALAPDGTIVAAGGSLITFEGVQPLLDVARYAADGTLLKTFARPVNGAINGNSVILQPDGKVVVGAGTSHTFRYLADGSLDGSFGIGGGVSLGGGALALQPDGMLITAGGTGVARVRWDGSLDAGGIAQVVFDPTHLGSEVTALAVQNDGKLLAAGNVFTADNDMALARFTPDGSGLDVTYGTDTPKSGHTFYGFFKEDEVVHALALRADGKAVVAGSISTTQNDNMMIGRFNTDGTADIGCAGKGFNDVDLGFGTNSASALAIAGDKVYVAGTVRGPSNDDFGLVRFADSCNLDGVTVIPMAYKVRFDLGGDDSVAGMVLDANGRPILAGTSGNDIVLIRVVGATSPDYSQIGG